MRNPEQMICYASSKFGDDLVILQSSKNKNEHLRHLKIGIWETTRLTEL